MNTAAIASPRTARGLAATASASLDVPIPGKPMGRRRALHALATLPLAIAASRPAFAQSDFTEAALIALGVYIGLVIIS